MENNVDLTQLNQNMFINKLILDLESSMGSFLEFYDAYCDTITNDVTNRIVFMLDDQNNPSSKEMVSKLVGSFFALTKDKLNTIVKMRLDKIKPSIPTIDVINYEKLLTNEMNIIVNQIAEYYRENINDLINELSDLVKVHQRYLNDYLLNTVCIKLMNLLKDNLMIGTQLIINNYKENKEKIAEITEKTMNKGV